MSMGSDLTGMRISLAPYLRGWSQSRAVGQHAQIIYVICWICPLEAPSRIQRREGWSRLIAWRIQRYQSPPCVHPPHLPLLQVKVRVIHHSCSMCGRPTQRGGHLLQLLIERLQGACRRVSCGIMRVGIALALRRSARHKQAKLRKTMRVHACLQASARVTMGSYV